MATLFCDSGGLERSGTVNEGGDDDDGGKPITVHLDDATSPFANIYTVHRNKSSY